MYIDAYIYIGIGRKVYIILFPILKYIVWFGWWWCVYLYINSILFVFNIILLFRIERRKLELMKLPYRHIPFIRPYIRFYSQCHFFSTPSQHFLDLLYPFTHSPRHTQCIRVFFTLFKCIICRYINI